MAEQDGWAVTDDDVIAELRRLDAEATKGEWRHVSGVRERVWCEDERGVDIEVATSDVYGDLERRGCGEAAKANARLIAAMRNALPTLLRLAERGLEAGAATPQRHVDAAMAIERRSWLGPLESLSSMNAALNTQVTALQSASTTLCEVRRALGLPQGAAHEAIVAEAVRVSRGTQPANLTVTGSRTFTVCDSCLTALFGMRGSIIGTLPPQTCDRCGQRPGADGFSAHVSVPAGSNWAPGLPPISETAQDGPLPTSLAEGVAPERPIGSRPLSVPANGNPEARQVAVIGGQSVDVAPSGPIGPRAILCKPRDLGTALELLKAADAAGHDVCTCDPGSLCPAHGAADPERGGGR